MSRLLEGLHAIAWPTLAQPPWNDAESMPRALTSLATSSSKDEAEGAYHRVLYALGNNHAGTYYPVVLLALPFLGEIAEDGSPLAREAALDVLIDVCGSFYPEPGYERVDTPNGKADLRDLVATAARELRPLFESTARTAASSRAATLATELLSLLDE